MASPDLEPPYVPFPKQPWYKHAYQDVSYLVGVWWKQGPRALWFWVILIMFLSYPVGFIYRSLH